MTATTTRIALVAGLAAALAAPAGFAAEPLDGHFPPERPTCYGRLYDAAHLERNRGQKTVEIVFGASTRTNSVGGRFYVGFRDRKTPRWHATGSADLKCKEKDGGLACFGECGAYPSRVKPIDARTIELQIEAGECGEDDRFGPDDRVFRLVRLPADYCATAQWVLGPPEAIRDDSQPFPPIPTE